MKSALFDVLNSERIDNLRRSAPRDSRPEVRALQEYFLSYPRCRSWPTSIEYGSAEGYWSVQAEELDVYEIAAVYAALEEITSVPVRVEEYRDGSGAVYLPDPETSALVKAEVAELRRLNLWGRS